jgi:hypothetical protein
MPHLYKISRPECFANMASQYIEDLGFLYERIILLRHLDLSTVIIYVNNYTQTTLQLAIQEFHMIISPQGSYAICNLPCPNCRFIESGAGAEQLDFMVNRENMRRHQVLEGMFLHQETVFEFHPPELEITVFLLDSLISLLGTSTVTVKQSWGWSCELSGTLPDFNSIGLIIDAGNQRQLDPRCEIIRVQYVGKIPSVCAPFDVDPITCINAEFVGP